MLEGPAPRDLMLLASRWARHEDALDPRPLVVQGGRKVVQGGCTGRKEVWRLPS